MASNLYRKGPHGKRFSGSHNSCYVTVPPSGRSAPSFRDPQETRDLPPRRSGVLHAPPHWKQSKMPKVGTSKAAELGDRAEEGG